MSNTISGGHQPLMGAGMDHIQRAQNVGFQTGAVGQMGKKETRTDEQEIADSYQKGEGLMQLDSGVTVAQNDDGSHVFSAPNGTLMNIDPEGNVNIDLPNGMQLKPGYEKSEAFDSLNNMSYPMDFSRNEKTGESCLSFKDNAGNKWKVNPDTLAFQVENSSETLLQKVDTMGGMTIETKTLSRDPDAGKFEQNKVKVDISPEGKILGIDSGNKERVGELAIDNNSINLTTRKDLNMGINLPYTIPTPLSGEGVKPMPQAPASHPLGSNLVDPATGLPHQQNFQPQPTDNTMFAPPRPPVQPNFPNVISSEQWAGAQVPGSGIQPPPAGQYDPVSLPNGIMRKADPTGQLAITLPNGIVMADMPDGTCMALDSRSPERTFPVQVTNVNDPVYGSEKAYQFQDCMGSNYLVYEKSPQFSVSSRDGNVLQTVDGAGNMMIMAKSYGAGQNGQPGVNIHKVHISNKGQMNTFGEQGVNVSPRNVVFTRNGQIVNYRLPYEIPADQPYQSQMPATGFQAPMQSWLPVPDPMVPSFPGYYGPTQFPGPGPLSSGPIVPPGTGSAGYGTGMPGYGTTGTMGTGYGPGQPANQQTANTQESVKPGIFSRIKNFFFGDDEPKPSQTHMSHMPQGGYGNNPGCFNPGGPYTGYPQHPQYPQYPQQPQYPYQPSPYPSTSFDRYFEQQMQHSRKMEKLYMASFLVSSVTSIAFPLAMFLSPMRGMGMGMGMW
jgi:hypothetical protein